MNSTFNDGISVSLSYTGSSTGAETINTSANAFTTTLQNSVGSFSGSFTTYCVDLANYTGTGGGVAGIANGTFADARSNNRNIGAAAWVVNNYSSLTDTVFSTLTSNLQKNAALQIAVWMATYNATITSIEIGNSAVQTAAEAIFTALATNTSQAFFVDFNNTGVNTVVQDQIAAVPVPAALFFVAPALIGVLGGMRRKVVADQAMAA
jgi:hypothetical protein